MGATYLTNGPNLFMVHAKATPASAATISRATMMMVTAIGSSDVVLTHTAEKLVGNMKKQIIRSSIPATDGKNFLRLWTISVEPLCAFNFSLGRNKATRISESSPIRYTKKA